jgi:SRSO17 transposase
MNQFEFSTSEKKLSKFVMLFHQDFERSDRLRHCHSYLSGLLLDGERKSIEPIAKRLSKCPQALQQFVNQSPWDYISVQKRLANHLAQSLKVNGGVLILDDTSLPKKGKHSVGVSPQYCGALGKVANCQSIVSWHYASDKHFPINAELFLPKSWTKSKERMKRTFVPEERYEFVTKWQLSLKLLNQIDKAIFPYEAITFDAGYGEVREFLKELDMRNEIFIGQIPKGHSFWPLDTPLNYNTDPKSTRARKYPEIADKTSKPISASGWVKKIIKEGMKWQEVKTNVKSKPFVKIMRVRVKEAISKAYYRPGRERWLVIEELDKGRYKYWVSNAPEETTLEKLVYWTSQRWKIEQGYQQLKEELGLDHFEGRSWGGLHRHITLCFMAYGFLILLGGKKNLYFASDT